MQRRLVLLAACGVFLATAAPPARAASETGCNFLWPLATELGWMQAAESEKVASGATLAAPPDDKAIELTLQPAAEVAFPIKPTSTPKAGDAKTFGGFVGFEGNSETAHLQVTLSGPSWVDVVQNGKALEATGHTGSKDCEGIRKSVRFEVAPGPYAIQVSGVPKPAIRITVRPAAD